VLRALMTAQLHEVHERGREAVAILWASEPVIYGRFGYGLASRAFSMKVHRDANALRADAPVDPTLRLRIVPAEDWKLTADVYATAARGRPGMIARDERWNRRATYDFPSMRHGKSALRCVVAEDDSGPRGYARYSTKPDWSTPVPAGTVDVREVIAVDTPALAALYRYLFDLDLMGVTELGNVPVDSPLLHWLNNTRATLPTWQDALYVRLVEVGAALTQRTYSAPVDVAISVTDPVCPWNDGTWRLVGGPDGARCERSGDDADISLSVTDLGGAYLGGTALAELAAAGRVQVREGAASRLATVSAAFSTSPAPWCPFVF
jgi:predicted acetyltransferase